MIEVLVAALSDIEPLVDLEAALFREDAGPHDPYADTTWPEREGRKDFGLLAGYATRSSSKRQPIEYAVLRTMYVASAARRQGVAAMLARHFLDWAGQRGCAEAHVDHYAANHGAAELYERCGFSVRSVSRVCQL
ncbi:MAG: GNAT family N-acetyltransferase [Ilumatobacteraceae bacterium]